MTAITLDKKTYKTRARFAGMIDRPRLDEDGNLTQDDVPTLGTIFRFKDGYLNGRVICDDSHAEYYVNGILHRENGPAVVCFMDRRKYSEYWINGELIKAVYPTGVEPEPDYDTFPPFPGWTGE